jgi:serine/threonine-protein kinase HipA
VRVTGVERATVHSGQGVAGTLERTQDGSRFTYAPAFLEACVERGWGLGFAVPLKPVVETRGVNLHAFFAGLLPEGLRLEALQRAAKTSADDLFSLLLAAGEEAVGDVRVLAPGAPEAGPPVADLGTLTEVSFSEVLARSLDYPRRGDRRLIPGIQPKVSAGRLTLPVRRRGEAPVEAILKLAPASLPRLVENEAFFMGLARRCGIETAEVELVRDAHGSAGLVVTRFDRTAGPAGGRLHCEDACQLLDRYPADKYRLSFREVLEGVRRYATAPALELPKVLRVLAYSYLIGNGDLHARNLSLLVSARGRVQLSPAYDLLTTLPYGDRRLALKVMGRDDHVRRPHLVELGRLVGVRAGAVDAVVDEVCDGARASLDDLTGLGLDQRRARDVVALMTRRRDDLA